MKDIRHIPLEVLLSFPTPNYIDPPTRGSALVIVNAIFISFVAIAVFLRLYTRIFLKRWFGSDDVFIIFAFTATVALTVVVLLADRQYYWNRHVWDVPLQSIKGVLIIAFIAKLVFVYAATFTRLSLLCFYYRLVQDSDITWFRWAIHLSVIFNVVLCIVFTCFGVWICQPTSGYWQFPPSPTAHCMDEGPVTLAIGIINIFADLFVTLLPVPVIIRLQMPLSRRIGVMLLLCLGGIVIIAGTVRTYYIWRGLMDSYDETWFTYPLWICAAVEIDLGVICACAPAIRPLTSKILASAVSSLSDKFSAIRTRRSAGARNPTTKSYLKFSNEGEEAERTPNSNSNSSIKKGGYIKSVDTDTTATTTTVFSKTDEAAPVHAGHDSLSFITSPTDLNSPPSTEPPRPQPQLTRHPSPDPLPSRPTLQQRNSSSLQIHRRESFELSSLPYATSGVPRPSYIYGLDPIPGAPGSLPDYAYDYGSPGPGISEEGVELDPRSRAGSPFGNMSHVRGKCPNEGKAEREREREREGREERKRGSLVGAGLGAFGFG